MKIVVKTVEKLTSASAFQLKGSGWYATDYAKRFGVTLAPGDGAASEAKSEGTSESKSESTSEAKTDSKSETKTESKPAVTTTKSD